LLLLFFYTLYKAKEAFMQYRPLEGVDASLILWWEKKVWGGGVMCVVE
jgi:hypothetical protein